MSRFLSLFALLILSQFSYSQDCVLRIKSHGCSGTVIATEAGRSWILGCAHAYESDKSLKKKHVIDGVAQPNTKYQRGEVTVLAVDYELDLSLLEIANGPFHCSPIAPRGYKPNRPLSCGYDDMKWPITLKNATIIGSDSLKYFTREKPWHGRSGGGLLDKQADGSFLLIGVCHGYEVGNPPYNRGIYVNHESILRFIERITRKEMPRVFSPQRNTPQPQFSPQQRSNPYYNPYKLPRC